ncbi:MAG: hypothetical protein QOH88_1783 [Verrucomicrobiota bacterium]|jgi:hypothetical protein
MNYRIKLIVCVLIAWIPSYFVCDYGASLAMVYISPANALIDGRGEMAVQRSGLGLARDGEFAPVSPGRARAGIFLWAGKWVGKYPVETLLGFLSFWWRWIAFGAALIVGFGWAAEKSPLAAPQAEMQRAPFVRERESNAPADVVIHT